MSILPMWHVVHRSSEGTSYPPTQAPSVTSVAVDSSSDQRYVVFTQLVADCFHKKRVSTLLPSRTNSFHAFVPTGNVHSSMLVVSIFAPAGRAMYRCFSAPSLHRCSPGSYGATPSASARVGHRE